MTTNRRPIQKSKQRARHDDEPIVTYSRLEAEAAASPHDFDHEPATPLYDAVEVPRATRPPPRDAFVAEPELRAERDFDDGVDPFEPEPRRGRFRLLIVAGIGVIGLVAGVGVLMATLGPSGPVTATTEQLNPPALSEPGEETDDVARTIPAVREIPLAPGSTAGGGAGAVATDRLVPAEPVAEVPPPAPRPRPEKPATETAATDPGQPAAAVPLDAPVATTAPAAPAATAPAGEDDFLRRIEQTLNRVEEPAPAATATPVAPAPVVVSPAPVATPAPSTATLQPLAPADSDGGVLPADGIILDEPGIVADEDLMMDGGGHFDFEQGGPAVLEDPAAVTTLEPLPTPPATFDTGAPLTPPNDLLLGPPPPATTPPPAKASRLQRLFPRLLPPAEEPAQPVPFN